MSGATLVNLLLDVKGFDYRRLAERDVEQALRELQCRYFSDGSSGGSTAIATAASGGGDGGGASLKSKSKLTFNIDEDDIQTVMGYVHRGLEKVAKTTSATTSYSSVDNSTKKLQNDEILGDKNEDGQEVEKMQPVLFPPGQCVHFYRDGSGISGSYVPCTFFNEIDIARTMIEDHLISSGYRKIFLNLMRDFHKDDHFSFESKGVDKQ